jgi:hypothetical protein
MIKGYNGNFGEIKTLESLKNQVCINALCFTPSIADAAKEVGIAEGNMYKLVQRLNLTGKEIKEMRIIFKDSGIKVKKRFKTQ